MVSQLFDQQLVQFNIQENITGPLWGEFHQKISLTKGQ